MTLTGTDIGKKFGKTWIFRNLNFELQSGESVAITGKNGAGKSTLLQIIAGYLTPSHGNILIDGKKIEEALNSSVLIGPYTEIIEELTLQEFIDFHSKFKSPKCSAKEMASSASLPLDKRIGDFSTGMKQRSKLITAFYFENEIVFFDEPTSNLDEEGFSWWKDQIQLLENFLVFIASNDQREIRITGNQINL